MEVTLLTDIVVNRHCSFRLALVLDKMGMCLCNLKQIYSDFVKVSSAGQIDIKALICQCLV